MDGVNFLLRLVWLAVLGVLFVGILAVTAGPWFALAAFAGLILYALIPNPEGSRLQ
jgi:hypothetical protein